MKRPVLVIGGGLSGLAAAIRIARFTSDVLLVEKHSRLGGLNSYFYRKGSLFETGLHAITNYAEPDQKSAPLNRLLRQLKLKRKEISLCQQKQSEIFFKDKQSLLFSNNADLLLNEIAAKFPKSVDGFNKILQFQEDFDPFKPTPFVSAKAFLAEKLCDTLLTEMLLCPLMYYGSSVENDMDLSQFSIMFRAIFQEGMFRPQGSIKDFIDMLVKHLQSLNGEIKTRAGVTSISRAKDKNSPSIVYLENGENIECQYILSTIGYEETLSLLTEDSEQRQKSRDERRLGFVESIFQLSQENVSFARDNTITFFNTGDTFNYASPAKLVDYASGVICLPSRFEGLLPGKNIEVRGTHLANFQEWKKIYNQQETYLKAKEKLSNRSLSAIEEIIGPFRKNIIYQNTFTPVTIERYTSKRKGAIYGHPTKIKDGDLGLGSIFLAGTDQGFLGIIGSMLSGVSIANQHILPKL